MKNIFQDGFGKLAGQAGTAKSSPCETSEADSSLASMLQTVKQFAENPREPAQLTEKELLLALSVSAPLTAWLKAVDGYALGDVLAGRVLPGWKAVEGRSQRQFTDAQAAIRALVADGTPEELLYERKPLSPAQMEKRVGTAAFLRCAAPFVGKTAGKPVLAPENDPRKAYSSCGSEGVGS